MKFNKLNEDFEAEYLERIDVIYTKTIKEMLKDERLKEIITKCSIESANVLERQKKCLIPISNNSLVQAYKIYLTELTKVFLNVEISKLITARTEIEPGIGGSVIVKLPTDIPIGDLLPLVDCELQSAAMRLKE